MATITQDLGKVAYLSKGAYSSSTQYEKNDVVTYEGSSYVSLQATQGNAPTNTTYWQLIAEKGRTGPSNELTIGVVEKGVNASATITGTSPNQVLNLVLPKGDKGDTGEQGLPGQPSGAPLVASSTSGMIDTTKVYVNTTDGYWYYYNGSAWVQGDVYQSTDIGNNRVSYNMLTKDLQENLEYETSIIDSENISCTYNKYIATNGTETSLNYSCYYSIDVNQYETYYMNVGLLGSYTSSQAIILFYSDNSIVSYLTKDQLNLSNDRFERLVLIPNNVNKMVINSKVGDTGGASNEIYLALISKYDEVNISKKQLDSNLQTLFTDVYENITPTLFIDGAYMNVNDIMAYSSVSIYELSVNAGEKYKITNKQVYGNPMLIFANPYSTWTKTISSTTYTINSFGNNIKSSTSNYEFVNYEFTIPKGINKIYINKYNSYNLSIQKVNSYNINASNIDFDSGVNPLYNKTLLFAGDSIMAASTTGVKGWVGIMRENNPNTNFYNYGHDGYTIAKANDEWSSRSIQNVLPTMLSEHPNPDYIVFNGGANDYWGSEHGITLGDITSGYNSADFDLTTFSGGLEYIINYFYTNFPKTKIAFIITHQVYASNFYQFMDRAKEICKKWSVPIINLFDEGNLNFNISYMRTNYSLNADGLHPNLDGYEIETPFIENSIKYKI